MSGVLVRWDVRSVLRTAVVIGTNYWQPYTTLSHACETRRASAYPCPFCLYHMGPSTKKRKEPPPNRTLLDFFSSADATKRARVRTSQQLAPSVRQTKVEPREIIVIGSDSDDGAREKENGARLDPKIGVSEDFQFLTSVMSTPTSTKNLDAFGVPSPPNPCVEAPSNGFHTHQQPSTSSEPDHSESVSALLPEQTSNSSYFWVSCGVRMVSILHRRAIDRKDSNQSGCEGKHDHYGRV